MGHCVLFVKQKKAWIQLTHICMYISQLGHHWFKWWIVTCFVPSHFLNQWWLYAFELKCISVIYTKWTSWSMDLCVFKSIHNCSTYHRYRVLSPPSGHHHHLWGIPSASTFCSRSAFSLKCKAANKHLWMEWGKVKLDHKVRLADWLTGWLTDWLNEWMEWIEWMTWMNDLNEWLEWMTWLNGLIEWLDWMNYMNEWLE